MTLTPLDVRRKEFDKAFRGYDPTEVDLFLKQVADQLEDLQEEVRRTEERTREAEAKLVHYEKVELALQEALESARESARRSEASAEEKARLVVREAELRAEKIVHDAERERYGLRQDVAKLGARQAEIAARLRGFLFSELEVLAQFQGDDPVGFIKLQPAGGHAAQGALGPAPARLEAPIPDEPFADGDREPTSVPEPAPSEPASPYSATSENADAEPEAPDAPPAQAPPAEAEPAYRAFAPSTPDTSDEPASAAPAGDLAPTADGPDSAADPDRADGASPPQAPAETDTTEGGYAASPAPTAAPTPPAVTGGWDLRSLVTGEDRGAGASDEEREAIRRILDDLD